MFVGKKAFSPSDSVTLQEPSAGPAALWLTTEDRSTLTIRRSWTLTGCNPATDSWAAELRYKNPRSQSPLIGGGVHKRQSIRQCLRQLLILSLSKAKAGAPGDLQYPLTIFPATTRVIRSQAFSDPSTGAPKRMTSSTTPSLPERTQPCRIRLVWQTWKQYKLRILG